MPATKKQKKQKIAAIITDLGGVLIDVDKESMCAKFAKYSSLSAEEIETHFSPTVLTGHEIELGTGLTKPQRFYELVSKDLKLKGLSFKAFNSIYSDRFTRKNDSITLVRKLSKNYPVVLLSNTNALHYAYWSKTLGKDMKLFETLVLSYKVGIAKPSPKIFLGAARWLRVKPQQCVYLDDVAEYVNAAKKVGMHAIHFVSASQLRKDLAAARIKV